MVCTRCGSIFQKPKRHLPGTFLMELFLFLLFVLPGLVYGVWRLMAAKMVCPACGSEQIVPETTPVGRQIIEAGRRK